jgi:hypothetical protein
LRTPLDLRGDVVNLRLYEDDSVPVLLPIYADLSTATITFTLYGDDGVTVLTKTGADGLEIQSLKQINPTTAEIQDSTEWSLVGFEPFSEAEWDEMATNIPCRYELRYEISAHAYAAYRGTWTVTKRIA